MRNMIMMYIIIWHQTTIIRSAAPYILGRRRQSIPTPVQVSSPIQYRNSQPHSSHLSSSKRAYAYLPSIVFYIYHDYSERKKLSYGSSTKLLSLFLLPLKSNPYQYPSLITLLNSIPPSFSQNLDSTRIIDQTSCFSFSRGEKGGTAAVAPQKELSKGRGKVKVREEGREERGRESCYIQLNPRSILDCRVYFCLSVGIYCSPCLILNAILTIKIKRMLRF